MAFIQFLDSLQKVEAKVRIISDHVIELRDVEENISGFISFSNKGKKIGDFRNYTTIYREITGGYQLSDDGSVYIPPEPLPEIELTLEDVINQKVSQMNMQQQAIIAGGCDVQLSDGTTEHFTLTQNDQLSLNSLSVKVLEGLTAIPWHASDEDEGCRFYTEEDMKIITDTCANFVTWHVTWFRDLRRYIRSLTSKEEVQAITYETNIPMEYRSEVLQALMVQKAV